MNNIQNYIKSSDLRLFFLFNHRLRCLSLNITMQLITQIGSWFFCIVFPIVLILSPRYETVVTGTRIAVILAFSQVIVYLVKRIVNRPRPYQALNNVIANRLPMCIYSFPSGHTCAAFCLALVLANGYPNYQALFLLVAGLVGISRIYLGVHYPTDVLVGFMVAYGSFFLEHMFRVSSLFI